MAESSNPTTYPFWKGMAVTTVTILITAVLVWLVYG